MPILRYFFFVGGALLALLFVADYVLPSQPMTQAVATVANDQPLIRIRSNQHLPERVVLDTTQVLPSAVKTAAVVAPQPPVHESASAALDEMSAKTRVRETFAQFTPDPKAEAGSIRKTAGKTQAHTQTPMASPQSPAKRKVARGNPAQPPARPMQVAQQPHFGLFDTTW